MTGKNNIHCISTITFLTCAAAIGFSNPAAAGKRGSGIVPGIVGGIIGGALNEVLRSEKERPPERKPKPQGGGGGGESQRQERQESRESQEARNKANENAAQREEAISQVMFNEAIERNRNVDKAIADFISVLEQEHKNLRNNNDANVRVSTGSNINQVTAGEIRITVEKAYEEAHLTDFDGLTGELWTRDRLLVQVLREARSGVLPYFHGIGAKGPDVANMQDVFREAAKSVYLRALELSDIVGVSYSFDRFIRTIYENSDRAPQGLWTVGADVHYERVLTRIINSVDKDTFSRPKEAPIERTVEGSAKAAPQGERLSKQFEFRFRARRSLYDCLAASYVELTNSNETSTAAQLPSAGGERGARVEIVDRLPVVMPGAAEPGLQKVASAGNEGSPNDLWQRAQQVVGQKCRAMTVDLARTAENIGLRPISARWNSVAGSQKNDTQFLPVSIEQPR